MATVIWEVLELALDLLILYIVLKMTEPDSSSRESERLAFEQVGSRDILIETLDAEEQRGIEERFIAHNKDMAMREFQALLSSQHQQQLSSILPSEPTFDQRLGYQFFNMGEHDQQDKESTTEESVTRISSSRVTLAEDEDGNFKPTGTLDPRNEEHQELLLKMEIQHFYKK